MVFREELCIFSGLGMPRGAPGGTGERLIHPSLICGQVMKVAESGGKPRHGPTQQHSTGFPGNPKTSPRPERIHNSCKNFWIIHRSTLSWMSKINLEREET